MGSLLCRDMTGQRGHECFGHADVASRHPHAGVRATLTSLRLAVTRVVIASWIVSYRTVLTPAPSAMPGIAGGVPQLLGRTGATVMAAASVAPIVMVLGSSQG